LRHGILVVTFALLFFGRFLVIPFLIFCIFRLDLSTFVVDNDHTIL
jgi:hypothetical protein